MVERLPLIDARRVPSLAFAPRLDPRLHRALARLDGRRQPIAETYRALTAYARERGIYRPSYEHVRRLVALLRELRAARRRRRRETALVLFQVAYNLRPPTALIDHVLDAGPSRPP